MSSLFVLPKRFARMDSWTSRFWLFRVAFPFYWSASAGRASFGVGNSGTAEGGCPRGSLGSQVVQIHADRDAMGEHASAGDGGRIDGVAIEPRAPLRQRMIDDLRMRKLAPRTQACKVTLCWKLAIRHVLPRHHDSVMTMPGCTPTMARNGGLERTVTAGTGFKVIQCRVPQAHHADAGPRKGPAPR